MIDAKELRIGNLIARKNYPHDHLRVEQIKWQSQIYFIRYRDKDDFGGESAVENFVPIPLTPELLEACGFVKSNPRLMPGFVLMRSLSFDKYRRFRWDSSDGLSIETVESGWIWNLQEIRCLHQFQNLVHALTNTEIEVNLNKEKV